MSLKKFNFIFLIMLVFICVIFLFPHKKVYSNVNILPSNSPIKVIAHRANYFDEPENSILGIRDCINYKVDYAEIDVQESKDGIVVLMHDKNLKRLTGLNKSVNEVTYKELRGLKLHHHFFIPSKEKIPTLQQVVNESKNKVKLIIEIKPYGNTDDLTRKVVRIIEKNNITKVSMIHSSNYHILLNVKRLNPSILTGYIINSPFQNISNMDVNFFSVRNKFVTPRLVTSIHNSKKQVFVWVLDNRKSMMKASELNTDGIITDNPNVLKSVLKKV